MSTGWFKWMLVLALAVSPRAGWSQCSMGGTTGGGHQHGEKAARSGDQKARQKVKQVLAGEESRALLLEAILADPGFMRQLVGRIVETPEWRALAVEKLGTPAIGTAPVRPDSLASGNAAAPQPAAVVYRCPMHAEVASIRPGKCPKCGMTLERAT